MMTPLVWLVIALVMASLELITGTFYLLLISCSVLLVSLAAYLGMSDLTAQILLLTISSTTTVFFWRRHRPKVLKPATAQVNLGNARYINREFVLVDGIANDGETIRVPLDDSTWNVRGPSCAPGTRVKVVNVDGGVIHVLPVTN